MSKEKRAGKWIPGNPHKSDSMGGKKHFDVNHFDDKGKKDGKLHISGEKHPPSMKDVHHPPLKSKR